MNIIDLTSDKPIVTKTKITNCCIIENLEHCYIMIADRIPQIVTRPTGDEEFMLVGTINVDKLLNLLDVVKTRASIRARYIPLRLLQMLVIGQEITIESVYCKREDGSHYYKHTIVADN